MVKSPVRGTEPRGTAVSGTAVRGAGVGIAVVGSAAVSITVVALLISGCAVADRSDSATNSPVSSALAPFFDQTLSWSECGGATQCASISAPIDWDNPQQGEITLALARLPAPAASRQGSVLLNPGGPGGSGVDFVVGSGEYVATERLRDQFDIVSWDPRGVGASTRVTCLPDDSKDALLYRTWSAPYGTQAWVAELTKAEKSFVDACVANTGPLLEFVDSQSTAHDMDLIRALLGESTLNYLGYSYGTYFGAHYAELFPDRVGRFVLDGATDPTRGGLDALTNQMVGFDSAMSAFLDDCVRAGECPLGADQPQAQKTLKTLIASLDARKLPSDDARILDVATLGTAIASALYSQSYWPQLSTMFAELQAGNALPAFALADLYNGRSLGSYADNSLEVYTATLCLDSNFQSDSASTVQGIQAIDKAAPLVGAVLSYDDYAQLDVACSLWPYPAKEQPASFSAVGANPIMVVGTTNDPATPYRDAQALARQLSSGFLVTRRGEGHTAYAGGNECIDSTVDSYFISGAIPATDPNC